MEKVTCSYCEYFDYFYLLRYTDYIMSQFGLCSYKDKCLQQNACICENFKLRQGLYTSKWYPDKKGPL